MRDRIITIEEILEILEKYNIGKKPLSLVLGWGEVTIIRYLDGSIPDKLHSDVLFSIKNNSNRMLEYLEENKSLITDVAIRKVKNKIRELEVEEDRDNLYLISKHIIAMVEDITPLALQKILYYIDGFSMALLNRNLFLDSPEAWVHGPVYKDIYDRYSYYRFYIIDNTNFSSYINIEADDNRLVSLIDEVIKNFGCYSGKVLEEMTHLSNSWIKAREGLEIDEVSSNKINKDMMREEFVDICNKYNIDNYGDISKYSSKLFRKIVK